MNNELEIHPLAEAFFDLLPPDEFEALKADIKRFGQRQPIAVWEGKILDGRNRFLACRALDIEPDFSHLKFSSEKEAADFVMSCNSVRRHLTTMEKTIAQAKFEQFLGHHAKNSSKIPQKIKPLIESSRKSFGLDPAIISTAHQILNSMLRDSLISSFSLNDIKKSALFSFDLSTQKSAINSVLSGEHTSLVSWRKNYDTQLKAKEDRQATEARIAELKTSTAAYKRAMEQKHEADMIIINNAHENGVITDLVRHRAKHKIYSEDKRNKLVKAIESNHKTKLLDFTNPNWRTQGKNVWHDFDMRTKQEAPEPEKNTLIIRSAKDLLQALATVNTILVGGRAFEAIPQDRVGSDKTIDLDNITKIFT